jgi:hypothetical protein
MKPLALTLALCALVASGSAAAEQTCKAKATQQKLAGEALISFVKQCESDALMACTNQAAGKPDTDSFMDACVAKAVGAGPRWCVPHDCKENSDCRGGRRVWCLLGRPMRKVTSNGCSRALPSVRGGNPRCAREYRGTHHVHWTASKSADALYAF